MNYDTDFPIKTTFHRCAETDTLLVLCDDEGIDSSSIFSSADWVIQELAQQEGHIRKRVYFHAAADGLVELVHDGSEFKRFARLSDEQEAFLRKQVGV